MITVRLQEPLARHTAMRTGGPCEAWVVARTDEDVALVIHDCRRASWKLTMLGAGTRTVVRDGGQRGAVLRLGGELAALDLVAPGAGAPMPALVELAARAGRGGLEAFVGVPGSLGASLLHDDGWDELVDEVYVLQRGARRTMSLPDVRRKQPVVLGARLALSERDPVELRREVDARWRHARPGSWYTPPKPVGRQRPLDVREVLASVRLPMVRLREVAVPALAPELLINLGHGTAADLLLLHRSAIERVVKVRGIDLGSRIGWMGEA
ncbi:MAG: FAD-binding protein [Alphaproteobacteria bacterium]|nr:FAD-binding protein [Alphaproteobacteria bacterium]MCB9696931.1 FAD-binding protein [Alphaproteobacteria bacterium]